MRGDRHICGDAHVMESGRGGGIRAHTSIFIGECNEGESASLYFTRAAVQSSTLGTGRFFIPASPLVMRVRTFFFITALLLCHLKVYSQTLIRQFPSASELPDAPQYPIAEVVPASPEGVPVRLESKQQEKHGSVYLLTGDVRIEYKDYTLSADRISYNDETKDAE